MKNEEAAAEEEEEEELNSSISACLKRYASVLYCKKITYMNTRSAPPVSAPTIEIAGTPHISAPPPPSSPFPLCGFPKTVTRSTLTPAPSVGPAVPTLSEPASPPAPPQTLHPSHMRAQHPITGTSALLPLTLTSPFRLPTT